MKRKVKITVSIIIMILVVMGFSGFYFVSEHLKGDPDKINETAYILKEKMEEKYGTAITSSEGFYTNMTGYSATLTTETGVTFDAWNRPGGPVDFYMEEVWRKKGLAKWGYADTYIADVENVDLNIGYRDEAEKDQSKLSQPIEEVKDDLWLTLYVDIKNPYQKKTAKQVEQEIYRYYEQLQKDGAKGVELIVRHDEDVFQQDTGSYMTLKDDHGEMPDITGAASVAETIFK